MVYADFARKSQFVKAVRQGEPVVLWDAAANQPAINGVVVVAPISELRSMERWSHGRRVAELPSWHCTVRVRNAKVVQVVN